MSLSLAKSLALAAFALLPQSAQAVYTLNTTMTGGCFLEHFTFFNETDPTSGFVQYIDQNEALSSSMIDLRDNDFANASVYIGVDSSTFLSPSGPGRKSIRLQGTQVYTHGLVTLDVYHAPTGCGTWPALWMVNPSGPYPGTTGEIDIFETVNNLTSNSITLHTDQGCLASPNTTMAGTLHATNCWVDAPGQGNSGCSVSAPSSLAIPPRLLGTARAATSKNTTFATAGSSFNDNGGGVFALVWTPTQIQTFFFPRLLVPEDLIVGHGRDNRTLDPTAWVEQGFAPIASFAGCNFDAHLSDLALVVDTDFCGGWVDSEWSSGGCAAQTGHATCADHVAASPAAFEEAHWLLGGVEVWQSTAAGGY